MPLQLQSSNFQKFASLEKIKNNYPKFLLTTDLGEGENEGIKRINVFDWLIGKKKYYIFNF